MRDMALREAMLTEKQFLRRISKAKDNRQVRPLILEATPKQIRILQCLVISHMDDEYAIPINKANYRKLQAAGKISMLTRNFANVQRLCPLDQARQWLLKLGYSLRIFTSSFTG